MEVFKLTYDIKEEGFVKLFDLIFYNKNKAKCKVIIGNKLYPLIQTLYEDKKN